jgi:hypothetical protein
MKIRLVVTGGRTDVWDELDILLSGLSLILSLKASFPGLQVLPQVVNIHLGDSACAVGIM